MSTRLGRWKPFQSMLSSFRCRSELAAVQLDDELLLNRDLDVFARRQREHLAAELLGIELQPFRHAAAARRLDAGADLLVLATRFADHDRLTGPHLERRDRRLAA